MDKEWIELAEGFDRIDAVNQIENLMGAYAGYHTAMRHIDYMKCWARRNDCILEMPWGEYRGYDGVERCYLKDHGDRSYPETLQFMKGLFCLHCVNTGVVEVAQDGKTARGVWLSPGVETFAENGEGHGCWAWSKYGVDFINENGSWKIWRMKLYPLFQAPYDTPWTQTEPYDGFVMKTSCDNPLREPIWQYGPQALYPAASPEPPLPYDSYDDAGYIW